MEEHGVACFKALTTYLVCTLCQSITSLFQTDAIGIIAAELILSTADNNYHNHHNLRNQQFTIPSSVHRPPSKMVDSHQNQLKMPQITKFKKRLPQVGILKEKKKQKTKNKTIFFKIATQAFREGSQKKCKRVVFDHTPLTPLKHMCGPLVAIVFTLLPP